MKVKQAAQIIVLLVIVYISVNIYLFYQLGRKHIDLSGRLTVVINSKNSDYVIQVRKQLHDLDVEVISTEEQIDSKVITTPFVFVVNPGVQFNSDSLSQLLQISIDSGSDVTAGTINGRISSLDYNPLNEQLDVVANVTMHNKEYEGCVYSNFFDKFYVIKTPIWTTIRHLDSQYPL